MKIGLLLPSILTLKRFDERIFAPKPLFEWLADELVNRGHEVFAYTSENVTTRATIVSGDKTFDNKDLLSQKDMKRTASEISLLASVHSAYAYEIDMVSRAFAHAKKERLDILHAYLSPISHYFASSVNIPLLSTLHDPVFSDDTLEYHRFKNFSQHNYNALSISQQKDYLRAFPINILAAIHHGVKVDSFQYSQDSQEVENYACFIGRYFPEKGIDDALQAAREENIVLKIATSINYKETTFYKEKIMPYIKHSTVEELPFLLPPARNEVLKNAKMLLFPIKWEEPFGMVMIEAMACGTPVIAYNRGSVPEIVKDGVTGFIIDPDDEERPGKGSWTIKKQGIEGLKEAIGRIGEIDRKACREHVENNFTVEKMVDGYEQVYKKIIAKNQFNT